MNAPVASASDRRPKVSYLLGRRLGGPVAGLGVEELRSLMFLSGVLSSL